MEKRFSNIFKTTNVRKVDQDHSKMFLVTSKWKILKQIVYLLRAVELWPTFDIQISINLALLWKKWQGCTF